MTDRDWAAIYSVVLVSLEDCDPPSPGAQLSDEDRDRIAETVSDHLSAALADGILARHEGRKDGVAGVTTSGESNMINDENLDVADAQLTSLLSKCEAVLRRTSLSPSRQTLMTNRVSALRTALELVHRTKARGVSQ